MDRLDNIAAIDPKYVIKLEDQNVYNYYDVRELLPKINTFSEKIKSQILR